MKFLLYAAYGSNLLKERFMVYIMGGNFMGRHYDGSTDKTKPEFWGWVCVPHRLYFANKSPRWENKGVAFLSKEIDQNPNFYAIVRLWKITEKQFEDLKRQEGAWYEDVLTLGKLEGLEIKTLTGNFEHNKNSPSEEYLGILKKD